MRSCDTRQVSDIIQAVAAELAVEAVDPAADLTMRERRALVALSLAVEAQAARAVGIEPRSAEAQAIVDRALAAVLP